MKILKRLSIALSLVLCVTMLFSGSTVFAMGNSEKEYKVSYSSREEKSVDGLLKLAFEQQSNKTTFNAMKSQDNMMYGLADNQDESNGVEVKQLLEERVYTNGSVQRDYVSTGLSFVDKDGVVVPMDMSTSPQVYTNTSYGVIVKFSLYFTTKLGWPYDTFRVDKLVTNVIHTTTSSVHPVRGYQLYRISHLNNATKEQLFTCNPLSMNQSFTLISSHSDYAHSAADPILGNGTYAQLGLTLSNGEVIAIDNGIFPS